MRPDNKKIAAIAMLTAGQATLSEVARLAGTSRQRVQHWARYGIEHKGPPWPSGPTSRLDLDVKAARDREANTEQEWQTLKAMAKAGRETKARPRRR